jgi:hypothetical protein
MTAPLCVALAALLLVAGTAASSAQDAKGRLNQGGREAAQPLPRDDAAGGRGPNALDDAARNDRETPHSQAANDSTSGGPNDPAAGAAPAGAPPGSSPQTTPSTQSAANAAEDRRSWAQRALQLKDEQKQMIRARLLQEKDAPLVPRELTAQAKVGTELSSTVAMSDLPPELIQQVPTTKGFKYVRSEDGLLLVDPLNWMVVAILD